MNGALTHSLMSVLIAAELYKSTTRVYERGDVTVNVHVHVISSIMFMYYTPVHVLVQCVPN